MYNKFGVDFRTLFIFYSVRTAIMNWNSKIYVIATSSKNDSVKVYQKRMIISIAHNILQSGAQWDVKLPPPSLPRKVSLNLTPYIRKYWAPKLYIFGTSCMNIGAVNVFHKSEDLLFSYDSNQNSVFPILKICLSQKLMILGFWNFTKPSIPKRFCRYFSSLSKLGKWCCVIYSRVFSFVKFFN